MNRMGKVWKLGFIGKSCEGLVRGGGVWGGIQFERGVRGECK